MHASHPDGNTAVHLKPGREFLFPLLGPDARLVGLGGSRKVIDASAEHVFGDCKQAWVTDCDSWMGRRLWRTLNGSGLFTGKAHVFPIVETEFAPGKIGYGYIQDFGALARRGITTQDEYDRFLLDMEDLASKGEYLYSINLHAYAGVKA